jgi:hypothetical protein
LRVIWLVGNPHDSNIKCRFTLVYQEDTDFLWFISEKREVVLVKTLRREKTGLSPIGTICNDSFEDRIPDVGFIVLVVQMGNILEFDQVFPEGDLGQVGNGSYIQLFHNIILVGFHGLRADTESL